ncbi:hypothetical protein EIN_377600 [Entamoeba invadens IP1]|uniref:Uncharacterized protein n=1 Tax=Entamoeba invadens IP1 TaxID=370355 RepID=A0A0A1TU92_ENTIV|nr:hypothetical protein EIN_377600 [Entamoeba invadens IP1]ELP83505.1 hypothetical protein EIN_377600 [Entamoeba invadens IP1]|eukprot:XP_004182851.1 hypothetical protein EIN_377600 [Entamoeba invadens IP1]
MSKSHKLTSKEKFIKWRNYQSSQESVFLAIINQYCDITIHKPVKKALVTLQFVQIDELSFSPTDTINFSKLVQNLVKQRLEYEVSIGVLPKTAMRRSENYRFTITLNLLVDLLSEFRYVLNTKPPVSKKAKEAVRNEKDTIGETIHSIAKDGIILFGKQAIERTGRLISCYLNSIEYGGLMVTTIYKNDKNLAKLLTC